jgi:hypothetical protein
MFILSYSQGWGTRNENYEIRMQSRQSHDINTALRGNLFEKYRNCVGFTTIQHNSIKQIARKEPYITEDVFLSTFSRLPIENDHAANPTNAPDTCP